MPPLPFAPRTSRTARCGLALMLLAVAAASGPVAAQVGFTFFNDRNHPEIDWRTADTEHFTIVYPARLAGIEVEAAAIAEATYAAITRNLSTPDHPVTAGGKRMLVYLSDEDEIANGVAYEIGPAGSTAIWVHVNEFATIWTGDVKWLRKVLAHEIAHLLHYRAVRSNVGIAQNLLADPLPSFWAEGLAQYQTERWDAQRGDRWLRTATFEDRLNYDDGTSPQNGRLKYAVGNSQVRVLADLYGDSTVAKILAHRTPALFGLARVHDFQTAFEKVVGTPYSEFNEDWRKHVNVYYNTVAGQMERLDSLAARPFRLPGQVIYDVAFSPDTATVAAVVLPSLARPVRRLITVTNPGADSTGADLRILAEGAIEGPIGWSPDGQRIAFARTRRGRYGSFVNDLYVVERRSGAARRLTTDRRATSPSFSPDGRELAFVGVDGATANVYALDLATRAERALTAFTGDVQITTARWSPDGQRVAFATFGTDGRRDLLTVDVATGTLAALPTGPDDAPFVRDDRIPVWNAAGDSLAFTSLRDGAPNAFVVGAGGAPRPPAVAARDRGADAETGRGGPDAAREDRVTFLFDGATVHDWLPPDAAHPAGRFVLVASETKRRDRVYVVDARRRPTVAPVAPAVPPAYARWTMHRPPTLVPDRIPPDTSLIASRGRYRSLRHLRHAITLPLPYADPANNDYGVFANSIWLEPLGKHQLFFLGGISVTRPIAKSFLLLEYVNRTLAPTITLDLYRFPSPSSFYGNGVLVEDLTGGDVSATLPLDVIDRPYTTLLAGTRLRLSYAEPYEPERFTDLDAAGGALPVPEAGTRFDVQLGLAYKFQRPYRYNLITPLDGTGLRARVTTGLPGLGAPGAFVRPDVQGYWVSPSLGVGRLFVEGRATAQFGRSLPQDYVGLARYDDVDVQLPFVGALTLDDAERVRGYRRYAVGTRALFGSAELRFPILLDLQTTVLGAVRFGAVAPALFADAGLVWTGSDLDAAVRRLGVGAELKNVVSVAGFEILQSVGLGVPSDRFQEVWDGTVRLEDLDLYYRIQAAIPF